MVSGRVIGDRYRLESIINRGGMGTVWRAADLRLDRPVAVKVLQGDADRATLERLDREARTVARLSHPNIVAVYDLILEAGVPYLVMELIEGDDLQTLLTSGPLILVVSFLLFFLCWGLKPFLFIARYPAKPPSRPVSTA